MIELDFAKDLKSLRRFTLSKVISFLRIRKKLISKLEEYRPDFVYFSFMPVGWGIWRDMVFIRSIRKAGVKTVYHLHNRGIQKNSRFWLYRKIYNYVFNNSRIIHLSPGLLRNEIISTGIEPEFSIAIGNGIESINFKSPVTAPGKFRVLFVSNLFPGKGIYLLPRILSQVLYTDPDIQFRVVGDFMRREYERCFRKELARNNIGDQLILTGAKTGVEKWNEYASADIFIFPSMFKMECFPLVIIEAMQAGLPIVSSRIGAIPEIISHGQHGFLVDEGDTEGFARYIMELHGNKERRIKMGEESGKKFRDEHTLEKMEKEISTVFWKDQTD
jgi:glycosyltransferase involved in cell wall biosynthesis